MKKVFLALSIFLCSVSFAEPKAEEITYDWLVASNSPAADYAPVFKKIFNLTKARNLLQFGVGYSTKYFADSCSKVISIEFVTDGCGPDMIRKFVSLYQECSNWIPVVYFTGYSKETNWATYKYLGSDSVHKACAYQCATHKSYAADVDDFYLAELSSFIKNLGKARIIDIAFVDPSIYLRGDLVQILFNKVPIILAHDINIRYKGITDDVYGYSRIETPDNYEEIFFPTGHGTTAWILKNEINQPLINELKAYANRLY